MSHTAWIVSSTLRTLQTHDDAMYLWDCWHGQQCHGDSYDANDTGQEPERIAEAEPLTGSALLGSRLTSDTGPEFEEVGGRRPSNDTCQLVMLVLLAAGGSARQS